MNSHTFESPHRQPNIAHSVVSANKCTHVKKSVSTIGQGTSQILFVKKRKACLTKKFKLIKNILFFIILQSTGKIPILF